MENAAEALKLAAAVLIFVVALSICVNALAEARIASQTILDYKDREFESEYLDYNDTDTERIVGLETIVPSIYKSFEESYKVVFKDIDGNGLGLYKKNGDDVFEIYGNEGLGLTSSQIDIFIKTILYGTDRITDKAIIKNIQDAKNIEFYPEGIFDRFKNKTFKEKSGVFYKNEVEGAATSSPKNDKIRTIRYELQ